MKFNNIVEWISYLNGESIEKLFTLIPKRYNLYEQIEDWTKYKVDRDLLLSCLNKFKDTYLEETFWSNVVCFIDNESFLDEIFDYLMDKSLAQITLCHLPLKDEFLWRLIDVEEEAILTLGKRYYTDDKYSLDELRKFLLQFKTCDWLWRSLIDINIKDSQKKKLFRRMLFAETDFHDYKYLLVERAIESKLQVTSSVVLIKRYYKTGNYRFFRGIAQNPNTPNDILEELLNIEKVKYAKQIRNFALENIKSNKNHNFNSIEICK